MTNNGTRTQADSVWNDSNIHGGASGGGRSHVFSRPPFQYRVRSVVGSARGTS